MPAPEELVGLDFAELSELFLRYRNDRRSCLLIGIQRGDEMMHQPHQRRGRPAAGRRPAHPLQPDLSQRHRSRCRSARRSRLGRRQEQDDVDGT